MSFVIVSLAMLAGLAVLAAVASWLEPEASPSEADACSQTPSAPGCTACASSADCKLAELKQHVSQRRAALGYSDTEEEQ